MSAGIMLAPGLAWAGYLCLAGGAFALWLPVLGVLPLAVPVLAPVLRRVAGAQSHRGLLGHARWQMNTFWLLFMLLVALVALFGAVGVVFSDGKALDAVESIGNAYSAGTIGLGVVLERFWAIADIRYFTWGGLLWMGLVLVWPLKRVLQGAWGMLRGQAPARLDARAKGAAFVAALIVQAGLLVAALGVQRVALWGGWQ